MITCSNCRSNQLDGTIFCTECGASLMPAKRESTVSLVGRMNDDEGPVVVPAPPPAAPGTGHPTLVLVVLNSARRIRLDLSEDLLIGRRDDGRGIAPDVDLGRDGGYEGGVSRRHAILSHKDGVYRVEDLSSANGTFVNGKQIPPQTPVPLASGDELKCGMLFLRVEIE
ncbi:MAG TPA: FHA domain-containing protein [Roseiflexaceae bacterium]|nr:FHA domain-containing protein [Roseiflexaceae bacterium]